MIDGANDTCEPRRRRRWSPQRISGAVAGLLLFVLTVGSATPQAAEAPAAQVISGPDEIPAAFQGWWKAGDYLLSDGEYTVVIGATPRPILDFYDFPTSDAAGSIISAVPTGEGLESRVSVGSPSLTTRGVRAHRTSISVEKAAGTAAGGLGVDVTSWFTAADGLRARVETSYRMQAGSGRVEATARLTNVGDDTWPDVDFSLLFDARQMYGFSPYDAELHADLGVEMAPKAGHTIAWVQSETARRTASEATTAPQTTDLGPGQQRQVRYELLVDAAPGELLRKVWDGLGVDAYPALVETARLSGRPFELVVRDAASSATFFRSFLAPTGPVKLTLPEGTYSVTVNDFPAVITTPLIVRAGSTSVAMPRGPAMGLAHVRMRDSAGRHVPGKVTFVGVDDTPTPYFRPHDPLPTGRYWETRKNSVLPTEEGTHLELPIGRYLAYASRGPEYGIDELVFEMAPAELVYLEFEIDRVVDTSGLLALDTHLHTLHSDGSVDVAERLRSAVAEGLDVVVSTDHFRRVDYTPELRRAGLAEYLAVMPGSEISIRDPRDFEYTLDFNPFPLGPEDEEPIWTATETLRPEAMPIFEATRQRHPAALVQLNHVRSSSWDYFNSYRLDPESAAFARPGFWSDFDLIEVMNGPFPYSHGNATARRDWLNLLSRGYRSAAVGTSDAHQIDADEPGYSRTYVYQPVEDVRRIERRSLLEALRGGRSFVTNGPILNVLVDGHRPGDTLTSAGQVEVRVEVRSAPWISVDEARILVNGERWRVLASDAPIDNVLKLRETVRLTLPGDAHIVVEAVGRRSLYPVVQAGSTSDPSRTVLPYALSNPVFVDIDGNGRFDPPLTRQIRSIAMPGEPASIGTARPRLPQDLRIVALGDSTTAEPGSWGRIEQVYVQRLPQLLATYGIETEVINAGIGNTTTAQAIDRLDRDVRTHDPDVVIVQFGINDSWIDVDLGRTDPRLTRAQFRDNLRQITTILRADGAHVILMTPNTMRWAEIYASMFRGPDALLDVDDERGINELLDLYVDDVRQVAGELGASLVDVAATYERYDRAPAQDIEELLVEGDLIHPNDAGHAVVTRLLVSRILEDLPGISSLRAAKARRTEPYGVVKN